MYWNNMVTLLKQTHTHTQVYIYIVTSLNMRIFIVELIRTHVINQLHKKCRIRLYICLKE